MIRILMILIILLPLLGCNKQSSGTAASSAAVLPAGWPVAGLTLPADAQQHPLPYTRQVPKSGGMYGVERIYPASGGQNVEAPPVGEAIGTWEICFTSNKSWTEILSSAESGLISAGYTKLTEKNGSSASRVLSAGVYLSGDKKTLVMVIEETLSLDDNSGTSTACTYTAHCSPVPMPQEMIDKMMSKQ